MILALLACGTPPETMAEVPFTCQGSAAPSRPVAPPLPLPEAGADWRLAVERLDSGPAGDSLEAVLSEAHLSITAVGAPLSAITAVLTEQTGLSFGVEAAIDERAVTMRMQDISPGMLLLELSRWGIIYESHDGGISLSDRWTWSERELRRARAQEGGGSLLILMVPLEHPEAARPILETWCAHHASSAGEGAVLGDRLLLKDHEEHLSAGRELLREFDRPTTGAGQHFSCTGKPYEAATPHAEPPVAEPGWSLSLAAQPGALPLEAAPVVPPERRVEEILIGSTGVLRPALKVAPLDVEAKGAPAGALGVALSEAVGVDVGVSPHVARMPVTMSLRGADLETLSEMLQVCGVWVERVGDRLWLHRIGAGLEARRAADEERSPVVTEVWPLQGSAEPELWAWCELMASPAGQASVLGGSAVVSGREDELAMLREILSAAQRLPDQTE